MNAIAFDTTIRNGLIEIPAKYHDKFFSDVKVILLRLDETAPNQRYELLMQEAGRDKSFMSRTISCSDDFATVDSEVFGEW